MSIQLTFDEVFFIYESRLNKKKSEYFTFEADVIEYILGNKQASVDDLYNHFSDKNAMIDQIMKNKCFSDLKTRDDLIFGAKRISNYLYNLISGKNSNLADLERLNRFVFNGYGGDIFKEIQARYTLLNLIDRLNDGKKYRKLIRNMGSQNSRKFIVDLIDKINEDRKWMETPPPSKESAPPIETIQKQVENPKTEVKDAEVVEVKEQIDNRDSIIEDYKNALELVTHQLEVLQAGIETIKLEAQEEVITDFIKSLNSTKNGTLLDNFVRSQKTLTSLKAEGFVFPQEIESIPILIKQFTNFIRKYEIKEIKKLDAELTVTATEASYSEYHGTKFKNKKESKKVKVKSPGWRYKETVISLPVFVEIKENIGGKK